MTIFTKMAFYWVIHNNFDWNDQYQTKMVIIEKSTMLWVENFEDEKISFYNETENLVRIFFRYYDLKIWKIFPPKTTKRGMRKIGKDDKNGRWWSLWEMIWPDSENWSGGHYSRPRVTCYNDWRIDFWNFLKF